MKQIVSYSNYTVVKEWSNEELENTLTNDEKKLFRKYDRYCPKCDHELSFIIQDTLISIEWYFICTYCHRYEQYINFGD